MSGIRVLRRLMYCGEWIESHSLHVFLLHAPDFFGFDVGLADGRASTGDVVEGAPTREGDGERPAADDRRPGDSPDQRPGRRLLQGTREGATSTRSFRRSRSARELASRRRDGFFAGLDFPDFEQDYEFVALRHPERYAIEDGRLVSSSGLDIGPGEYEEHFSEQHVPHSTALQSRMSDGGTYFLGPMARYSLNFEQLSDGAKQAAADAGLGESCRNPFKSILVRSVEILYALEEALALISAYEPPDPPAVVPEPRASTGTGWSEAPRGMLWHRYRLEETARSPRPGSCRPPPRTRPGSSRTCTSSSDRGSIFRMTGCSGSASRRSETTTPASAAPPTS